MLTLHEPLIRIGWSFFVASIAALVLSVGFGAHDLLLTIHHLLGEH